MQTRQLAATTSLALLLLLASCAQANFAIPRNVTWAMGEGQDGANNCSATMIGPQVLLTAAHCVIGDREVFKLGQRTIYANKQKVDQDHDLAWFKVEGDEQFAYVPVAPHGLELDENVVACGYPLSLAQICTTGRSQGPPRHAEYSHYTVTTAPVAPGNSGGGLFVFRGGEWFLVGVCSAVAGVGMGGIIAHLNLFVSHETIQRFLAN